MQFVQIFTFTAKPFTFLEFHKKFYSLLSPSGILAELPLKGKLGK